jgi:hypothetical protein
MKFKVKLKSLARRLPKPQPVKIAGPEDRVTYPTLYMNNREFPAIAGLKHGDKVNLVFKAEVSDKSSHDYNGDVTHDATFRLKEGAVGQNEPAPKNTTEAIHQSSKASGGLGRIISDFRHMAEPARA